MFISRLPLLIQLRHRTIIYLCRSLHRYHNQRHQTPMICFCPSPSQIKIKRTLHRKMLLDTPDPQEGEDFFDYVYRRAQRPVDPWALDTSHIEEVGSKVKARRKNKSEKRNRSNEMTLKQQREDELRRDKNDSGASGDLSDMMTLDQGEDRSEPNIVDHGGEDEEYYEQLNPEELIDELPLPREGKRIRVKRQLGDFTSTKVSYNTE